MEEGWLSSEPDRDTGYEEGCNSGQCDWSELTEDALELIIYHLPIVDRIAVSCVCRSWRSIMLSVIPHDKLSYGLPCLVYMREAACHLVDPVFKHRHTFEIRDMKGARVVFSRGGWLLLSRCHCTEDGTMLSMFFWNPFSKLRINLPCLKTDALGRFSVSDCPTSPSCVVVGFLVPMYFLIRIGLCRRGDDQWTVLEMPCNIPFLGFLTNPTWYSGSFHCLDARGSLGVFDPSEQTWSVMGKQEDLSDSINKQSKQYLVESDGDLLRVCYLGDSVVAFKFDSLTNRWVSVKSLGDKVLFIGEQDSISSSAVVQNMKGKIYFSTVRGEDVVRCSLESNITASVLASGKLKKFWFSSWVDLKWSQPAPNELEWSSI